MGTLLRYLVIALFVVLFSAWMISIMKGCNENQGTLTEQIEGIDDLDESLANDELEEADLLEGDADYNEELDALDAEIAALEEELGEFADREETDPEPQGRIETPAPAPTPAQTRTVANPIKRTNLSPNGASFMVIAGSYSKMTNAEAMEDKLNDIGHNDVEIVQFDLSKYYSVCAGRFNNADNAKRISDKLNQNGINAYVHKRRN